MTKKISVLIIDDSALMRNLVSKIINNETGLTVAGTALNGRAGLNKVEELNPDFITLDLEMPELDGIAFLKELRKRKIDTPVIILSSLAYTGARITIQAMDLGACDFVTKPSGSISLDISAISKELCEKIFIHYAYYQKKKGLSLLASREEERPLLDPKNVQKKYAEWPRYTSQKNAQPPKVLCMGASTGGPFAIKSFLSQIPSDFPLPILIVQHMPKEFTGAFAESLNSICSLKVEEGTDGAIVHPGKVYIAPGNAHMILENKQMVRVIRLTEGPLRSGHRPSVDTLFASAAEIYEGAVLAILLTGMGEDGAREMGTLFHLGAITIAQDQYSSVVYGMPKIAIENGYAHHVLSLDEIPEKVNALVDQFGLKSLREH